MSSSENIDEENHDAVNDGVTNDGVYVISDLIKVGGLITSAITLDPEYMNLSLGGVIIDGFIGLSNGVSGHILEKNTKYRNLKGIREYHDIFDHPIETSKRSGRYLRDKFEEYRNEEGSLL